MNDFIFQNTTKVYFGQNQLKHLHEEVLRFGDKILIAHGGEFIKNSSLYSLSLIHIWYNNKGFS